MVMLAPAPEGSDLEPVPGDPGLPYLGYILQSLRDPVGFAAQRRRKYGAVSWSNFLGRRMVGLQGPEAAQIVLTNRDKAFANGPAWGFFIGVPKAWSPPPPSEGGNTAPCHSERHTLGRTWWRSRAAGSTAGLAGCEACGGRVRPWLGSVPGATAGEAGRSGP